MDREPEDLQFLSLLGIYRESSSLLLRSRRLFLQIAASLVLPLSFLFLAHIHISHYLFTQIDRNQSALENSVPDSPSQSRLLSRLASEWSAFLLFKAAYLLFLLVFSLLSTSAVVYVVASLFSSKDVDFKKVFTVVPKVWRRLMVTFLWAFLLIFAYSLSAFLLVFTVALLVSMFTVVVLDSENTVLIVFMLVFYLPGLVWLSVIWHLASVVSVLEDLKGINAMQKSRNLIKGKTWTAVAIFVKLNLVFGAVEYGFRYLVVKGHAGGAGARMGFALLFLAAICAVVLFALVVQTVVYFVCKSYHHESIDRSSLADHLEVYLGDYVPLKERDVQLEQYYSSP